MILALASIFSAIISEAKAETFIFPLDYEITSDGAEPQGPMPWVTATFIDVSPDNVQLTMSASNLTGTEFITKWFFNSGIDATGLTFTPDSGNSLAISTPTINTGLNAYKADGDGYFDIRFDFQTSAGTGRFTSGETVIYNIGGSSLSASSFNFISAPDGAGTGLYYSAAKVQGINGNDNTSGWIANTTVVPEPISSILFLSGGATLAVRRYLRRGKKISLEHTSTRYY